ncbi:glycosyltransferase family 2 protein [Bradyrhizobium sp. WSM1253]|uniref:glycosyltransferase family 2 protein n=1 Tax=Bradyrhizobium sp. WSM1253 TaxID=319003 RepID=UPI00025D2668|nr:glycosyltransferase family 2 protein [Bradyrhizobium sp. WSM1253]EIG62337.1 glycosyl transferase [Bradyrhizobium sp. WSM1253]
MNDDRQLPRMTIVCPVYNEEKVVPLFFARALPVIELLAARYRVELLFLNNASADGTYAEIGKLRAQYDFVYVITLSANVGYQRSLECGLRNAHGDVIAFIDVDCEDPPEMLLDFVSYYEKGFDIVYGARVDREEARPVKMLRKLFYHVVRSLADEDIILYMAEFSLLTSEVRDAIVNDHSSFPFIRASISRVGFKRIGLPYKRQRRIAGKTNYNFVGMTIFAIAGILSSTTLPLRLPIYALPLWLLLTAVLGAAYILAESPWLLLLNVLCGCTYFGFTAAFTALYVARSYKNGLGRPNYVVNRRFTHAQRAVLVS